jgi:hypothetical protein
MIFSWVMVKWVDSLLHSTRTRGDLKVAVERVGEIGAALNDANHIACGISKNTLGDYQRLPGPRKTRAASWPPSHRSGY